VKNRLHLLIEREPYPLYAIIKTNNYSYRTATMADYRYEIMIWQNV
jgi:hypothetical protein